jgi:hypothetical protein
VRDAAHRLREVILAMNALQPVHVEFVPRMSREI